MGKQAGGQEIELLHQTVALAVLGALGGWHVKRNFCEGVAGARRSPLNKNLFAMFAAKMDALLVAALARLTSSAFPKNISDVGFSFSH